MTPKILLACPRYDNTCVADAFMSKNYAENNPAYGPDDQIEIAYDLGCHGSLLNWVFNNALAEALNKRDEGLVTHMAMCHADLASDPGWCNQLYSIMRERGDIVVSAVACIKEPARIKTSCAVGSSLNYFNVKKYITTADRPNMPETFSTRDVAESEDDVLLVNTGMWLADLSWPMWDQFAFSFNDAIMINPTTGKRQAATVPEDWGLSYFLHKHGAPYSGTWRIRTRHHGPSIWDSHAIPVEI